MKKLVSVLLMALLVFTFGSQLTHASLFANVDITVSSNFDSSNTTVNNVTDQSYGSSLALDTSLGSNVDYTFAYWAINDVLQPDLAIGHTFDVTQNMDIEAYFTKTTEHLAIFVDANGNVLHFEYVADAGTVVDPAITLPDKPGMAVADPKWDNSLTNITQDTIFVLQYENDGTHTAADIAVSTSSSIVGPLVTGAGNYAYNQVVTVIAAGVHEANFFQYWKDADTEEILSYSPVYAFSVFSTRNLEAVYGLAPATPLNDASITDVLEMRDGYYTYVGQFGAIADHLVLEYGVITNNETGDFNLQTDGINTYQVTRYNSETNEFVVSIPKNHYAARAYLVVKNTTDDSISIVYSNTKNYSTEKLSIVLDFEDESKSSYNLSGGDTVTIDGNDWLLDDALIGTTDYDQKVGNKSLRVDDSGNLASEFAFTNGVDTITFLAARYGTDSAANFTVQYAYEWDPTNWITLQDGENDYSLTIDQTSLTSYSVNINVDASIYIRILKTSGSTRINFDNVEFNPLPDITTPVISGAVDNSVEVGEDYDALSNVTAQDNRDGIITSSITYTVTDSVPAQIGGSYSSASPFDFTTLAEGTYTVDYTVTDSSSNTGTASMTLTVTAASAANPVVGTELFFSEIIEEGGDKAIEIYNPTAGAIDLSDYKVILYSNDKTSIGDSYILIGTLGAGETFVLSNAGSSTVIDNLSDDQDGVVNHNGNDAYELYKISTDSVVDVIGLVGAGVYFVDDRTLVRNPDVHSGNATWTIGEWTEYDPMTTDNLGEHTVTE